MKKLLIFISFAVLIFPFSTLAKFKIDFKEVTLAVRDRNTDFVDRFRYKIESQTSIDDDLDSEIKRLTRKAAYLLLGEENNKTESFEAGLRRREEFLQLIYSADVPKDSDGYLDENSAEYNDNLFASINTSGMFKEFYDLDVDYSGIGTIEVTAASDLVISKLFLPKVTLLENNSDEPLNYKSTVTNLTIYFVFKQNKTKYQLYYIAAEKESSVTDYVNHLEDLENTKSLKISIPNTDFSLSKIYSLDQLTALSENHIKQIYQKNISNVLVLNTYYDNSIIQTGSGFFIGKGLVLTTWTYLENALQNGQYISFRNGENEIFNMIGVTSVDVSNNLAIIKVENKNKESVLVGDSDLLSKENPVVMISTKSGVGFSIQGGAVISSDKILEVFLPVASQDAGAALFNSNGEVVGMNTSIFNNSSTCTAIKSSVIKQYQDLFHSIQYDDIFSIPFDELKKDYYNALSDEKVINVNDSVLKKYASIGFQNTIQLPLVKANYSRGTLSLRYQNPFSNYFTGMEMIKSFTSSIISQGYQLISSGDKKKVYQNDKYKIIITEDFHYVIVIIDRR